MTSLEEIHSFIRFLEANESMIDKIAHSSTAEARELQEAHLRVVLAKKNMEWLLDNYMNAFPSGLIDKELSDLPDVGAALSEGIDAQINLV
jgi:hypothetical protein